MLRRIVSVFGVVALMVALLVAMAAPAMAQYQNCSIEGTIETCSGCGGGGGGGFGFGSHCEVDAFGGLECSGKGFGGNE